MTKKIAGILTFLCLMLLASIAFAADGPSVVSRLVDSALEILAPVVALFAMWAAHKLIKVFESKTSIDVPAKTEEMIDEWLLKAVAYAEEKGRTAVKTQLEPIKGPEKLEMAVNFVLDLAEKYNLKGLTKEKVTKMVEAKLGLTRQE